MKSVISAASIDRTRRAGDPGLAGSGAWTRIKVADSECSTLVELTPFDATDGGGEEEDNVIRVLTETTEADKTMTINIMNFLR